MKKKLLPFTLTLALLTASSSLFTTSVMAKTADDGSAQQLELTISSNARTPKVELGEGQIWWANYDVDGDFYTTGSNIAEHYDIATFIPSGLVGNAGTATIGGLSFIPSTNYMDNVKIWVANQLPGEGEALETVTMNKEEMEEMKFNGAKFGKEYTIPEEGLYVGVSFDITSLDDPYAKIPVVFTDTEKNRENALFYRTTSGVNWTARKGNAAFKILVGGGSFPKYAASVSDFGTGYVIKDGATTMPVTVMNRGTEAINNISFTITTNGVATAETTIATTINKFEEEKLVYIPFAADAEAKTYEKTLTITKVNGQPNEWANNTSKGNLITLSSKLKVTPLVEEFMGTKAAGSPYAMYCMDEAQKQYGDKAIILAVHCSDVMQTEDYLPVLYNISSYPMAVINRQVFFSIMPSSMTKQIDLGLEQCPPATIDVEAKWTDADSTSLAITSNVKFAYNDDNAQYALAYVLVANGLKGTGDEWKQKNGYTGKSGIEGMQFWYDSPEMVEGIEFNDVPVAAWNVLKGTDDSVPSKVTDGGIITHTMNVSIADNKLLQDKSKLYLVAMLIDRSSGYKVANSAKTLEIPSSIKGIFTDDDNAAEVARYDLSGRRVGTSQKGITVIKTANGKSIKAINK